MITYIRNLFAKEREKRDRRAWNRGFYYAAGKLLADPQNAVMLEAEADGALDGDQFHPFNCGMRAALARHAQLTGARQ